MARQRSRKIERNIYRVTLPSGEARFRVQVAGRRVQGRRLSQLCRSFPEAQALRDRWLSGEDDASPAGPEAPAATVEDGLRHYVADLVSRGKNPSRAAQVRAVMADVIPELLGMPLSVVDARALYRFRDRRERAGIKANTIIRDLRVLRAMLKKARPDFTVPADVFPPENLIRVRMFSPEDEARALSTDGPEPFQTMERLAPLTLIRQGNLRMLRRDQVHLEQALILLPRTKGGPRAVALGDEAVALLRRQLARHPSDWVFPNPQTGQPYSRVHVSRVWRQRLRALGIYQRTGGFTWHDLKHHGAMVGLAEGASFPELQAAGGWQSPTMVNRYATASSARLRDLQNRQSARRAAQGPAEPSPPSPR